MRTLAVVAALLVAATAFSGEPKKAPASTSAAPATAPATAPASQPAAAATPSPEAIVAYREAEMMAVAKHFKAMSMIAKGEVTRPQGEFIAHAEALHALSRDLVSQFPAGTEPGKVKTESKAEIWTDAAGFAAAAKAFEDATLKAATAARANDAQGVKDAMSAIGQSCGGCHEKFRVDD
jgi:cytochrome c556